MARQEQREGEYSMANKINIVLVACTILAVIASAGLIFYGVNTPLNEHTEASEEVQQPLLNNYDITPPEIKNFGDRLNEK